MTLVFALAPMLLCSACPASSSSRAGAQGPRTQVLSPGQLAALTVPPSADSLEVFTSLGALADEGNQAAAWQRAHYLLDLFDSARFAEDAESRGLLGNIAGRPEDAMRGPAATQAIAELILVEIDHLLEIDRGNSLAGRAHTLVSYDAVQATTRHDSFQRSQELKRIVAQGGELAESASLRLFGYCRMALQDALESAGPARRIAIAHCLYPLFASDPEPYFESDPALRPPPPSASVLVEHARKLLVYAKQSRLRSAFQAQEVWLTKVAKQAEALRALDPVELHLPPAAGVLPFDDYPLVSLDPDHAASLRGALLADGRGVAGLALASEAAASGLMRAAQLAASAGASQLALLVRSEQRLRVVEGDYWTGRMQGESVARVGALPVSLALIDDALPGLDTTKVKAAHWDPSRAALELHLLVAPDAWQLVSPLGFIASMDTSTKGSQHPRDQLRARLEELRRAFPDEDGLILVPLERSSHGAIVAAAEAARLSDQGQSFFSQLALRPKGPAVAKGNALQKRIARRSAATVAVNPSSLKGRLPIARRCYLDLVDKNSKAVGLVSLQLTPAGTASVQGRPDLGNCASKAFAGPMQDEQISAIEVQFSVQAK